MNTEDRNPRTVNIDLLDTPQILMLINDEDDSVPKAVRKAIPEISRLVDKAAESIRKGGKLVYAGAGTSGRLGVLDAAECPPTFSADERMIRAIIAGGRDALSGPVEGAEDNSEAAVKDLNQIHLSPRDVLFALSASGRTPYALSAVRYAKGLGATTAGLSCNQSELLREVDIPIFVDTGPEVISGSTRMKAGRAEKLVLNSVSTAVMIRLGRVYRNYMVDVQPVTEKTRRRAIKIVSEITRVASEEAEAALVKVDYHVKTAIVMLRLRVGKEEADKILARHGGDLRSVFGEKV
jgi:N-acetylmuramic acid 6-phosphate etherase